MPENLLRHSGAELARALAEQCLGVFGAIEPTDEHFDRLADALLARATEWADKEFQLGLGKQYSVRFFRVVLFNVWSWRIDTPDGRELSPLLTFGWVDRTAAEEAALRRIEQDQDRDVLTAIELRARLAAGS